MIHYLNNVAGETMVTIGIDDKAKVPGGKDAAKMKGTLHFFFVFVSC